MYATWGGGITPYHYFNDTINNFLAQYTYHLNLYVYQLVSHSDPTLIIHTYTNSYNQIWESVTAFENLVIKVNRLLDTLQLFPPDPNDFKEDVSEVPCRRKWEFKTIS